jgi:hypothetical protein
MDKMRFYLKSSEQTYFLELEHTVRSSPGNVILVRRLITPVFLLWSCFSRIITNRRFSINLGNPNRLEEYL